MIVDQLRSPQKVFKTDSSGVDVVEYKPPTQLMLRAASIIEQLNHTVKNLQLEINNIRGGVQ